MPEPLSLLIDLSARRLYLRRDGATVASYPVAIGKPETPTPVGNFEIIEKLMYPGGVLGTRWMHFGNGYGIHGTNAPELIGQQVSNGCVRMFNADVEDLYPKVPLGTPLHIVYAAAGSVPRPLTPSSPAPTWGHEPSPGERIAGAQRAGTYTVVAGDTLWLLARRFSTTVEALVSANNLANPDQIAVGQVLILPPN